MAVAASVAAITGQQLDHHHHHQHHQRGVRLSRSATVSSTFCCWYRSLRQDFLRGQILTDHFLRLPVLKCGAASTMPHSLPSEDSVTKRNEYYTVSDFMTPKSELFCAQTSTSVDQALEMLVENRITGLPVVDEDNKLVGVVSDYDLLALDSISGKRPSSNSVFPEAGSTWKAFKEIQHLLTKTQGKTVGDVMTPSPLVVREDMNIEDAARILLDTKYRRLPVVDDSEKLVGLITRGNVVRAALQVKRAVEGKITS